MRIVRQVLHLKEPEIIENADAVILLFHNSKGQFLFIYGEEHMVHHAFLEGCLRWPSVIDWEDETKRAITDVLRPRLSQGTEKIVFLSREVATGEHLIPGRRGAVSIIGIEGKDLPQSLTLQGIDDALLFLWVDGKVLVGADGFGSEKKELMFLGAEILFGEKVSNELRQAVYGVWKGEFSDGSKFSVNLIDLARKMLHARRANNVGPGYIVLTADTWAALAEEEAKKGRVLPSQN